MATVTDESCSAPPVHAATYNQSNSMTRPGWPYYSFPGTVAVPACAATRHGQGIVDSHRSGVHRTCTWAILPPSTSRILSGSPRLAPPQGSPTFNRLSSERILVSRILILEFFVTFEAVLVVAAKVGEFLQLMKRRIRKVDMSIIRSQ